MPSINKFCEKIFQKPKRYTNQCRIYNAGNGGNMDFNIFTRNGRQIQTRAIPIRGYIAAIIAGMVMLIAATGFLTGCLSYEQVFHEPGIYEGESRGYRGYIRVRVSVSETGIEDIEILENSEDSYTQEALEELRELVMETGTTDLDVISGATITSAAFLDAVETALGRR